MRKRCDIITDAMPVFTVSVHQNSYTEEYVKGAQVFYFWTVCGGKRTGRNAAGEPACKSRSG